MKAFLDIETGGFSITKNGICEIAIIVVDDELNQVARLHQLIKPYKRVVDGVESNELVSYKDDVMKINGLTEEQLRRANSAALHFYECMLDLTVDPSIHERMYGCGIDARYVFLEQMPNVVSNARPEVGRFALNVDNKGKIVLNVVDRGPETFELEEMVQCLR